MYESDPKNIICIEQTGYLKEILVYSSMTNLASELCSADLEKTDGGARLGYGNFIKNIDKWGHTLAKKRTAVGERLRDIRGREPLTSAAIFLELAKPKSRITVKRYWNGQLTAFIALRMII